MPSSCVAPGCRSGYEGSDNTGIHFFAFPDGEKYPDARVRWISKVPRLNWNPGKKTNIKICHKHFRPEDITYESNDKRRTRAVPLQQPRLKDDAVPSIWPNLPEHLTTSLVSPPRPTEFASADARKIRMDIALKAQVQEKNRWTNFLV